MHLCFYEMNKGASTGTESRWVVPGAGGEDGGYGLTDAVWFYSHEVSSIIKCTEIEEL